jgi:hypothetical protein
MVARNGTPHPYLKKFNLLPPYFDHIGYCRSVSGYRNNQPTRNPHIDNWLREEGLSTGDYYYAKGNTETSFNATSKYSLPQPIFDHAIFSKSWRMVNHRWSIVPKSRLAVNASDWMDLTTSPGYPYCIYFATKRDALANTEVSNYINHCFDNFVFNGIWTTRCKKEPKKLKKILEFNSRVITAAPLDILAPAIRLFAEQNSLIYDTARRHKIPCTVGVSKFYKGWHVLYQRLTRHGAFTLGMECDFSSFDGSCCVAEFEQVMNLRFGLLVPELQHATICDAFRAYYADVVHTKILMDSGDVIQKHTGGPSGHPNTIVDNSLINEFRWYYAWCVIMPEEMHNILSFTKNVELLTCGDDSVLSISSPALQYFNPSSILSVFTQIGWVVKFASMEAQPVHTLSYCSQSFKWLYGYVVPVPNNYQKLLASLLYGGTKRDSRETLGRLLGVKIEAYFLTNFRSSLDRLISNLFERFYFSLVQPPGVDEFSYSELLILNRDFSAAYGLYLNQDDCAPHVKCGLVPYFDDSHIVDC